MKKRTVLIGLDGATFDLLNPLIEQGRMPFLKEFIDSGARSELMSVIPPLTPPAWTSLMTGRSPGHHGIFDFFQKEGNSQHIRFTTSQDVRCETIWSLANQHGKRVTTLNFPLMFPPPKIDGNVVSGGWMTWRQLRLACSPNDLYDRIKRLDGFNARELAMDMTNEEKAVEGCAQEEYENWIRLHIRREQQWFNVLKYLMVEDPCELTAILFDGVDKVQHLCWRFLESDFLEKERSPWELRVRDLCIEYFVMLDQILARIAELAGNEATIVMASDHGFGAQRDTFFVNSWLAQKGYLAWADGKTPMEGPCAVLGMGQLARHVYMLDWSKTKAYAATPSGNGIHIVTSTNNGSGVAAEDYEAFRQELIEGLYGLTSPTTGESLISRIWTREEAFDGPQQHLAPDLTLSMWDGGLVSILHSDSLVKPRIEPTGTHRPEGVFIAKGPNVRSGFVAPQLSIMDVAPFLLYDLGLPVPDYMEGRVPKEILESSALRVNPVQFDNHSKPAKVNSTIKEKDRVVFDAEAEATMAARLRALGYIE